MPDGDSGALYLQRSAAAVATLKNNGVYSMPPLFTILGSFLVGALILTGIGGIAYHLFRDDGLISRGMGALWEAHYQAPIMTILLIIAAIFVIKTLYSMQTPSDSKRDNKVADFVLFAFIATGIFFLGRLLTTGQL